MHRDRFTQLPSDRIALYEACIGMFFRRDEERFIQLSEYVALGERQKLALLSDFAYWLIKNDWSEVSVEETDKRFERKKIGLGLKTRGSYIRKYFAERSGILRQPTKDSIDFPHRTFQEYLAAKEVVSEGDFGVLKNNIGNDQWREVIQLVCGLSRRLESDKLILQILDEGDNNYEKRISLYLLSAICLEITVDKNIETVKAVQKRLKTIVPPKNMPDAVQLAKAGDMVVPFLKYDSTKKANELAASVRTLSIISGEKALKQLKNYSKDRRKTVVKSLLDGIKYCSEPENYAKELIIKTKSIYIDSNMPLNILTCLSGVKEIESSKILNDLSQFAGITTLRKLRLQNMYKVEDISPLKDLQNLEDLKISIQENHDLSAISNLKKLGKLEINSWHYLPDLTPLNKLQSLTHFHFITQSGCNNKKLLGLKYLTHLTLENPQDSDLSYINDIKSLEKFNLSIIQLRNHGFFSKLPNLLKLNELSLFYNEGMNLNFLSTMKNLKTLKMVGSKLTDLTFLSTLINLEYLTINTISEPNLTPLVKLKNLRRLELPTAEKVNLEDIREMDRVFLINKSINHGRPYPIFIHFLED